MALLDRFRRPDSTDLRQSRPEKLDAVNWYVFDHLVTIDMATPARMVHMTPGQRTVFAIDYLRQEVNSGGFDGYFGWSQSKWLVPVLESGDRFVPGLSALVRDAMAVRKLQLTAVDSDIHDFGSLDERYSELERQPIDERLDAFIAANEVDFFASSPAAVRGLHDDG